MYPQYMCILLYVTLIWCNGISEIYYLVQWYSIDVLSIGSGGYMYPQYMCILLYVIVIWCNGILEMYCLIGMWGVDVFSVYVHSVIWVTYFV